jgi:hypothetical protein
MGKAITDGAKDELLLSRNFAISKGTGFQAPSFKEGVSALFEVKESEA